MSTHFAVRFVMIAFTLGWILSLLLSHWTAGRDAIRQ
jgi:hypothetical protein